MIDHDFSNEAMLPRHLQDLRRRTGSTLTPMCGV